MSDDHVAPDPSMLQRGTEFSGRRVASNAMTLLGGRFFFGLIGFVTTPIVLSHVGLLEYGLWGTIMTTVAYITVVDPGFGDLVTRYGAQAHVRGNRSLGPKLSSLASLVWLGFGVLGLPIIVWAIPAWLPYLHLHQGLAHVALEFFQWGYAYTVAGCLTAIVSARLTAIGDQWLVVAIDAATRVVYAVVLVSMLVSGSKLSALVVASSVQLALTFVATIGFVSARDGAPYGNPFGLQRSMIREMTRFGSWLQLGGILELLTYETDTIVISTFVSVLRNGTYSLAQSPAGLTTYFGFLAQSSMLSAISAAYAAKEGLVAMRRMYTRAVRLVALLGCLIGGSLLGTAPVFLAFWLGNYQGGVPITDAAVCLTVAALLVGLPRQSAAATIMAMGRVGIGVRAQFAAFVVNLGLTIALVKPLGMVGVLVATLVAKTVATGYLLVRFHRLLEGSASELLFSWMTKLLCAIAAGAGCARLVLLAMPNSVVHERIPALAALLVLGAVYAVVFALVIRVTRFFHEEDLAWFQGILPGPLSRVVSHRATRAILGVAS